MEDITPLHIADIARQFKIKSNITSNNLQTNVSDSSINKKKSASKSPK